MAVAGYNIYLGGVKQNTSLITDLTYALSGLTASTSYNVTVSAVDTAGNESAQSSAVNFTTQAATGGGTPYEFFGLRKHNPDYTGPAIAVKADTFTTLTDIGFDANGEVDTAAIAAISGSATIRIAKGYGQYNGSVFEQTVQENMPIIMVNGVATTFDGIVSANFSSTSSQLVGPTTLTAENGLTALAVMGVTGSFSGTNKGLFGKWGTTAEYAVLGRHFGAPNDISILSKNPANTQINSQSGVILTNNQHTLISVGFGATEQYIKTNGVERQRTTIGGVRAGTNKFVIGGYSEAASQCEQETFFREILIYKSEVDPSGDETEINTKYSLY